MCDICFKSPKMAFVRGAFNKHVSQVVKLKGFRASMNPTFEGILDFMEKSSIHFNAVHRKVNWRNPMLKSLTSMPVSGMGRMLPRQRFWRRFASITHNFLPGQKNT